MKLEILETSFEFHQLFATLFFACKKFHINFALPLLLKKFAKNSFVTFDATFLRCTFHLLVTFSVLRAQFLHFILILLTFSHSIISGSCHHGGKKETIG